MKTLAEAIASMEGFYVVGSRPNRNNNPGDIEYGKFAKAHGATSSDGRFAIFPTPDAGWAALRSLLHVGYQGMTLDAALEKYAPSLENSHSNYLSTVARLTGLTAATVITPEVIG